MVYLNVDIPADAEKVSEPRGIFSEVKKCTLLYYSTSRSKFIWSFFLTMASRLSVESMEG